jgi:hypothetical protein
MTATITPVPEIPQDLARRLRLSQSPEARHIGYWREAKVCGPETGYAAAMLRRAVDDLAKLERGETAADLRQQIVQYTEERDIMATLPWPGDHCDPAMPKAKREEIANALNAIAPTRHYAGQSWDRLAWPWVGPRPWECFWFNGIGSGEVERAGWVWPQGLCWYVWHYGLVLPAEFLADVLA